MSEPLFLAASIVVPLPGNGFFSGSEIAIISARRSRIESLVEEGSRAAARVKGLQDNMGQFLATVQIGVTFCGTLAGVLGGILASRYIEPAVAGAAPSRVVLRAVGGKGPLPRAFVSEEEIKHLVREGGRQGVFDQAEMEIIHSVFEFNDMSVRKVMVPRPKIFALDADTPPSEGGSLIVESGFSRIPGD